MVCCKKICKKSKLMSQGEIINFKKYVMLGVGVVFNSF